MSSTARVVAGAAITLLTTELNSLANNASATSSVNGSSGVFDNSSGMAGDGSIVGDVELTIGGALGGTPAAGYGLSIWFLRSFDGTTFEGYAPGTTSTAPLNRQADVIFNFGGQGTPNSPAIIPDVAMPVGHFKALAWSNGAGVSLPSSGNSLKILPKATTVG
jgi:hypothetical protein